MEIFDQLNTDKLVPEPGDGLSNYLILSANGYNFQDRVNVLDVAKIEIRSYTYNADGPDGQLTFSTSLNPHYKADGSMQFILIKEFAPSKSEIGSQIEIHSLQRYKLDLRIKVNEILSAEFNFNMHLGQKDIKRIEVKYKKSEEIGDEDCVTLKISPYGEVNPKKTAIYQIYPNGEVIASRYYEDSRISDHLVLGILDHAYVHIENSVSWGEYLLKND